VRYDILMGIHEYPKAVMLAFLEDGDDVVDVLVVIDSTVLSERRREGQMRVKF